jgi:hypothetical protein
VRACVADGDRWAPKTPRQIGETLRAEIEPGAAFAHLARNPFAPLPDFRQLVERGFARWTDEAAADQSPIEFTEKGLAALEKFARPREVAEVIP